MTELTFLAKISLLKCANLKLNYENVNQENYSEHRGRNCAVADLLQISKDKNAFLLTTFNLLKQILFNVKLSSKS